MKDKTPAILVVGRGRGKRTIPCFINGRLSERHPSTCKCLVYWFDKRGDLVTTLVAIKNVQEAEFRLEG